MAGVYWRGGIYTPSSLKCGPSSFQYLLRCHRRCREKTAICPQRRSQVDLEQEEVRPYHSCAEGSAPLASHPSAYRLQDRSLCLQRPSWSWSDIPQPHLQSCPRGRRQGSPAICYSRRPDCASNQDSSLWAQKLPCLGTGRLELTARGHSSSGTVAGTFQIYVENTFISPCICLAALTALFVTVKERLISVPYIYILIPSADCRYADFQVNFLQFEQCLSLIYYFKF